MMNSPHLPVDDLTHDQLRTWLERALRGHEPLPRLTPDEPPHLGILRLEKNLTPATRDSLRDGCAQLVREFCAGQPAETSWVEELLRLVANFRIPESVHLLAQLARRFPESPQIPAELRLSVLSALVDMPPPQPPQFWELLLKQDPERHAPLALSGVLATDPAQAVAMLSSMPDVEAIGEAAALKLELAWEDLPPRNRFHFVQDVQAALAQCGSRFARPVAAWTYSKQPPEDVDAHPTLRAALARVLGPESTPRAHTSRLCSAA